jgi:hypothetical protein
MNLLDKPPTGSSNRGRITKPDYELETWNPHTGVTTAEPRRFVTSTTNPRAWQRLASVLNGP